MSRFREIAFLPDEDSFGFADSIRRYPVLTYKDVGLARGVPDGKVVEHAKAHDAIVLTRNVRDFLVAMRDAAAISSHGECKAMRCHEGGGLMTVHPSLTSFNFERVTRELRLGGHTIEWEEVFLLNLRVHLDADEHATVTILPVCKRCLLIHTDGCERCAELGMVDMYAAQGMLDTA